MAHTPVIIAFTALVHTSRIIHKHMCMCRSNQMHTGLVRTSRIIHKHMCMYKSNQMHTALVRTSRIIHKHMCMYKSNQMHTALVHTSRIIHKHMCMCRSNQMHTALVHTSRIIHKQMCVYKSNQMQTRAYVYMCVYSFFPYVSASLVSARSVRVQRMHLHTVCLSACLKLGKSIHTRNIYDIKTCILWTSTIPANALYGHFCFQWRTGQAAVHDEWHPDCGPVEREGPVHHHHSA